MGGGGGKSGGMPTVESAAAVPTAPTAPSEDTENEEAKQAAEDMSAQERLAKGRASTIKSKTLLDESEDPSTGTVRKKTLLGE